MKVKNSLKKISNQIKNNVNKIRKLKIIRRRKPLEEIKYYNVNNIYDVLERIIKYHNVNNIYDVLERIIAYMDTNELKLTLKNPKRRSFIFQKIDEMWKNDYENKIAVTNKIISIILKTKTKDSDITLAHMLYKAAKKGDIALLLEALYGGAELNKRYSEMVEDSYKLNILKKKIKHVEDSFIHTVADNKQVEMLEFLQFTRLRNHIDFFAKNHCGKTLLSSEIRDKFIINNAEVEVNKEKLELIERITDE